MKKLITKFALASAIGTPVAALAQGAATPTPEPVAMTSAHPQETQEEMTAEPVTPVGIFGDAITGRWTVTGSTAYGQSYTDNIFPSAATSLSENIFTLSGRVTAA